MREITITLYTLDELGEEAKALAIEANRNINVQEDWWEFLIPHFIETIEANGFSGISFYWDLDAPNRGIWCDDMAVDNLTKVLEAGGLESADRLLEEDYITLYFRGSRYRQNRFLVMDHDSDERARLEGALNALLDRLMGGFLDTLQIGFDHLTSDCKVAETLISDSHEFVANGESWRPSWCLKD
jgi:hypothetical protein